MRNYNDELFCPKIRQIECRQSFMNFSKDLKKILRHLWRIIPVSAIKLEYAIHILIRECYFWWYGATLYWMPTFLSFLLILCFWDVKLPWQNLYPQQKLQKKEGDVVKVKVEPGDAMDAILNENKAKVSPTISSKPSSRSK